MHFFTQLLLLLLFLFASFYYLRGAIWGMFMFMNLKLTPDTTPDFHSLLCLVVLLLLDLFMPPLRAGKRDI